MSLAATSAPAADRFWVTTTGGFFGSTTNWSTTSGGAGGAGIPGATDTAIFDLSNTYDVAMTSSVTNQSIRVDGGIVTLSMLQNTYTLTGAPSTAGIVGRFAGDTGRLTLRDGAVEFNANTDVFAIGFDLNATGFLTVTQQAEFGVNFRPELIIGDSGVGTLTVNNGGIVRTSSSNLGINGAGNGSASVSGLNSTWESGALDVGGSGQGSLVVQNGGTVTGATVRMAVDGGSVGVATVTGLGSTFSNTGALTVGASGAGTLNVTAGGVVATTSSGTLGSTSSAIGVVSVTGAGSQWSNSVLTLGSSGEGWLTISNQGRVTTGSGGVSVIAAGTTGTGRVLVTGEGSEWTVGSSLTVGNNGNALLDITSGGRVATTSGMTIGNSNVAVGTVTVSGAGSVLDVGTSSLIVSNLGMATLNVEDGATVIANAALTINDPAGAPIGTLNLRGGTITAGSFTRNGVFNHTDGTLTVHGTFDNGPAATNLIIDGVDDDDLPTLRLVSGNPVADVASVVVGLDQRGVLEILDARSLNLGGNNLAIGQNPGGSGAVTVRGANARIFNSTGDIDVGGAAAIAGGEGTLNIENGGQVTANGDLVLHPEGTIHIDGGTLSVANLVPVGGRINFVRGDFELTGANPNLSFGLLNTLLGPTRELGFDRRISMGTGNSSISASLTLNGGSLDASLAPTIINDALLDIRAGNFTASQLTNSVGETILVSGTGEIRAVTSFSNHGTLWLDDNLVPIAGGVLANFGVIRGSGPLANSVTNTLGGQIQTTTGERLVFAGTVANSGSISAVGGEMQFNAAVTNAASTGAITARNAIVRFDGGLTNNGSLGVTFGTSDVFGDIANSATGRIVVSGGSQATFYDDVSNAGVINVSASGSLQSTAVFFGALSGNGVSGGGHVFNEGDLRPGFSPGAMAFGGDLTFGPLSRLAMEIGGTTAGTQYDQVNVSGVATLAGTLDIDLINGFTPSLGQSFVALTFASRVGTFDVIQDTSLGGGRALIPIYRPTNLTLYVALPGDGNLDGTVNALDYPIWLAHYNQCGLQFTEGDYNGDGCATAADYTIWADNFGLSVTPPSPGAIPSAVPEPATWWLAVAGLCGVVLGLRVRTARPERMT